MARNLSMIIIAWFGFLRYDDLSQIKFADVKVNGNIISLDIKEAKNDYDFVGQNVKVELSKVYMCIFNAYIRLMKFENVVNDFDYMYFFPSITKSGPRMDKKVSYSEVRRVIIGLCVVGGVDWDTFTSYRWV